MSGSGELKIQKQFYEEYHSRQMSLEVETLKQGRRLDVLRDLIGDTQWERVLVIGCGQGEEIHLFHADDIVAFDLSLSGVHSARQNAPSAMLFEGDALNIPLASHQFDAVLCSEVIEHVLDADQLIAEISRLLKPNGTLFLSTPNWISWWGLARKVVEFAFNHSVTSGGQPVDNWFTYRQLAALLEPHFTVNKRYGIWYFPPTGIGMKRLPDRLVAPLMKLMMPIDRLLTTLLPGNGHLHAIRAHRR